MNNPIITAVGSSPFIAEEIAIMCQSILGSDISLKTATTDSIQTVSPNTLYVCASTQLEKLNAILPASQLFVFDLRPTTPFFFEIAKIPENEEIYIFNNLLPYTKQLQEDCMQILSIPPERFIPIAYETMPYESVCKLLQQANYIIGVDQFVDTNVLLSEHFKPYLHDDVTIIAGRRTPSISSASRFLIGFIGYYIQQLQASKNINTLSSGELNILLSRLHQSIDRIVTNQFRPLTTPVKKEPINAALKPNDILNELISLQEQLQKLTQKK
ncbi:MAG: hypothetical protein E7204_03075 [Veillonella sp.]|uniref:hypothetical protein n=1 Tax=Veillonella sp. TaxID=1926307 RepID=UPI0025CFA441|nr:hypothetical protein [Veillonella sp.]MBE6079817.1 hypothetical protein [Veillonella sp.]